MTAIDTAAHGTEEEATLRHLQSLDCDTSQGYLHSRPLAADDLVRWLTTHDSLLAAASRA